MRGRESKSILGCTYRDLIGGRWAISWIAYLINAPFNLVAIGSNANASSNASHASWLSWFVVWLAGYLSFGIVLYIWHVWFFRNRAVNPVPIRAVIVMGAIAGGFRGFTVAILAQVWGLALVNVDLVLLRTFTGAALGAILLPLAALLLASVDAYRTQRSALLTERRHFHIAALRDQGVTADLENALLASVQSELNEVTRTRDPELAREVSRRLWVQDDVGAGEPRLHWSTVLRAAVKRNPFATWVVAGIWTMSSIGTLIAAIGIRSALAQVTFSVVAIVACFGLGRRMVNQNPRHSLQVFVYTMVTLIVLTGPLASLLFDPRDWPAGAGLVIVNSLWLPLLAVGAGVISALVRSSESVLQDLHFQVSESEIAALAARDERDRLRRELAVRLHGTVQSRLLAASAAAKDANLAEAMLADLGFIAGLEPARGLRDRLEDVVAPWTALLEVSMELDIDDDSHGGDAIVRVIEEALTNAYRHAQASQVSISVRPKGDALVIVVRNDGDVVDHSVAPGIGSAILDSLASGGWTLSSDSTGTSLIAHIHS